MKTHRSACLLKQLVLDISTSVQASSYSMFRINSISWYWQLWQLPRAPVLECNIPWNAEKPVPQKNFNHIFSSFSNILVPLICEHFCPSIFCIPFTALDQANLQTKLTMPHSFKLHYIYAAITLAISNWPRNILHHFYTWHAFPIFCTPMLQNIFQLEYALLYFYRKCLFLPFSSSC